MGKLGVSAGSRGLRALVAGAIIGSLLCVQGCAGTDLPEGTWVVTSSEGHDLVEGTRPSMVLDGRGIRIDSGCNTLSGRVGYSHGVLSAKDLTSTLIGCDPDRLAQEEWLTEFFSAGAEVALQGDTMTLTQDRVTLTLERES
ncbi:META domain-containing protein [Actinomyces gerencseriae]|uniref:META domain-containing protein n=1 Tax=Actinomyces gerencseriae TaxID=52769 RepID=UPI0028E264AE|nr:META domain-containing protein [Actinomyces gerencseriae]